MQRYFSSSTERIVLSKEDIHHITHVMRMRKGDTFEVVFDEKVHLLEIESLDPFTYKVVDISSLNNELNYDITLFYALSKGNKNELVMQKATELGVNHIVLLSSSRSIDKMSSEDFNRKKDRFTKILKEASEQSKRNVIPEIDGVYPMDKIPSHLLKDVNLVAYEGESGNTSNTYNVLNEIKEGQSISLLIGSEGGISPSELEALKAQGFKEISLGKRILRTETAAIYALSVLAFMLER